MELHNRLEIEYTRAQHAEKLSTFLTHFFTLWEILNEHPEATRIHTYINQQSHANREDAVRHCLAYDYLVALKDAHTLGHESYLYHDIRKVLNRESDNIRGEDLERHKAKLKTIFEHGIVDAIEVYDIS